MRPATLSRFVIVLAVAAMLPLSVPRGKAQDVTAGIAFEVLNCPPGMSRQTLVSTDCQPVIEGFDVSLVSIDGSVGPLTVADTTFNGRYFVWDVGSPPAGTIWYVKETVLPDGYSDYRVGLEGAVYSKSVGAWQFTTHSSPPAVIFVIYNFAPGAPTTVTIHKAACPSNSPDPFGQCHGDVVPGIEFEIDEFPVVTDDNGVASHEAMPGEVEINEAWLGYGSPYVGSYVYCSEQSSGKVLFDGRADGGAVTIDVSEGDQIICDWYNLTAPVTMNFPIYAFDCAADPGSVSPAEGILPPEGCTAAEGATVAVETTEGAAIGECTIDATGRCTIETPQDAQIVVTEDEDTIPDGYAPRENPITTRASTEFAQVVFVNLPTGVRPTATEGAVTEPTATSTPGGTVLPNPVEGRPAHVHPGNCGKLRRQDSYDLTDLTTPTGDREGSRRATVAEASFTVIDVALDDLLANSHAVNVHESHDAMNVYIVCGEIGGVRRADGSLAVGLREVNGSGYEGIAYLAPDANDPAKTDVWVFVAPKLAEEERPTAIPAASPEAGTPVAALDTA